METNKQTAVGLVDALEQKLTALADAIFDAPQTNFQEVEAARLLCDLLEEQGFRVQKGLAEMETAFSGTWGSGKPVIGFLGEYDALSGLSQQAGVAEKRPLQEGGDGHGCGHNLLGVGSLGAACAVKAYLQQTGKPGTVVYYGCPAEEGGSGKTFMARDGVFDGLDCALYWHPGTAFRVNHDSTLANFAVDYRFEGISAHAAAAPHQGRSALDAVELMNIGVQFLREHMPSSARVHYAITDAGGISPGVVQAKATVSYLIRAPKVGQVKQLYERVNNIARGAALMTDTKLDIRFGKACSEQRVNQSLNEVLQENLEAIPLPQPNEEDLALHNALRRTIDENAQGQPVADTVTPLVRQVGVLPASGDLGDVSYICPTGELSIATWCRGTHGHSWQATAQGKSHWAHACMLFAGKVLAAAAIDLLDDPDILEKAWQEHRDTMPREGYQCPIPQNIHPPRTTL